MGSSVEIYYYAVGLGAGFLQKLTSLSGAVNSHNHIHSHFLGAFQSRRVLWASRMVTLAALCLIIILELLDHFEDLDIEDIEDLELELELDIGDIEDLELDLELEGELLDNIEDILELLNCLEDLQL